MSKLDFNVNDYVFRPTLDDDDYWNIKMKKDKDGEYTFESDRSVDKDFEHPQQGWLFDKRTQVTAVVYVGYYFSKDDHKYGMYVTLKKLDWGVDNRDNLLKVPSYHGIKHKQGLGNLTANSA